MAVRAAAGAAGSAVVILARTVRSAVTVSAAGITVGGDIIIQCLPGRLFLRLSRFQLRICAYLLLL